jgi:hypothetical protein
MTPQKPTRHNFSFAFKLAVLGITTLVLACTHTPSSDDDGAHLPATNTVPRAPQDSYEELLLRMTVNDSYYRGLHNVFQYHATLLTQPLLLAQIEKTSKFNDWDEKKLQDEKEKIVQKASNATLVFLAFYAPDRANDQILGKSAAWNILLSANGQKYRGKPQKLRQILPEIRRLYPFMDPWLTGYIVEFPVPSSIAEQGEVSIIITGGAGLSEKRFVSSDRGEGANDRSL